MSCSFLADGLLYNHHLLRLELLDNTWEVVSVVVGGLTQEIGDMSLKTSIQPSTTTVNASQNSPASRFGH